MVPPDSDSALRYGKSSQLRPSAQGAFESARPSHSCMVGCAYPEHRSRLQISSLCSTTLDVRRVSDHPYHWPHSSVAQGLGTTSRAARAEEKLRVSGGHHWSTRTGATAGCALWIPTTAPIHRLPGCVHQQTRTTVVGTRSTGAPWHRLPLERHRLELRRWKPEPDVAKRSNMQWVSNHPLWPHELN